MCMWFVFTTIFRFELCFFMLPVLPNLDYHFKEESNLNKKNIKREEEETK